ncbi:MAG: hypothetical protein Q7J77_10800 [Undibacterium sp.]|nr:hypothetical protein [Undibacterium sp.]
MRVSSHAGLQAAWGLRVGQGHWYHYARLHTCSTHRDLAAGRFRPG